MKITILYYLLASAFVLASCGEPEYPTPTPSVNTLTASKLTIVHVFPTTPRAQVKVDNRVTLRDTVRYEKAPDGKIYNTITVNVPAGPNRNIAYVDRAMDTLYVKERYSATSGTNNTTFLSYEIKGLDTLAKAVRIADDLALPDPGYAKVRFLNFSNDAGEVKLTDVGGTTVFSGRKFNEVARSGTDFARFTSLVANTYSYEVRTVAGDVTLLTIDNIKLDSKGIYTIYVKGWEQQDDGDFALAYGIIKH